MLANLLAVQHTTTVAVTGPAGFLAGGPPPASTLVQVAGLVHPDFRVEIEALAVL